MLHVLKKGLETTVQELPGRIGHWEQGFPPSGPADAWSFRLANLLVGNDRDAAAIEWQFAGPTLRFDAEGAIALTGAEAVVTLDGEPVPMWQTIPVKAGQVLACGAAKIGARGYIAVSGAIATTPVLGSRATFHMAKIGGPTGGALDNGIDLPLGASARPAVRWQVPEAARPLLHPDVRARVGRQHICAMLGPNDDWLDGAAVDRFFSSIWTVQARSNRTGLRLTGPALSFAPKATDKPIEHGSDPSNIVDHGYPVGGISLAGQTPIVFLQDSPSAGGFIVPFTVPSADLWRLGQARPGENVTFTEISADEADRMRRRLDAACTPASLVPMS